jgi:hypothetical protein
VYGTGVCAVAESFDADFCTVYAVWDSRLVFGAGDEGKDVGGVGGGEGE